MTSTTELVARLREHRNEPMHHFEDHFERADNLMQEAADAIATLERERDEAQLAASVIEGTCNEMDLELTASQAQIERLKEALAYIARGYSGEVGVNAEGHSGTHCAEVARAALHVEESKG